MLFVTGMVAFSIECTRNHIVAGFCPDLLRKHTVLPDTLPWFGEGCSAPWEGETEGKGGREEMGRGLCSSKFS